MVVISFTSFTYNRLYVQWAYSYQLNYTQCGIPIYNNFYIIDWLQTPFPILYTEKPLHYLHKSQEPDDDDESESAVAFFTGNQNVHFLFKLDSD